MCARGLEPDIDRQSDRGAATVLALEARPDEVDRPAGPHSRSEPRNAPNCAQVAEGQCADIVVRGWRRRGNPEIRGALPYVLGATKDGILLVEVDSGLEHDAVGRLPGADRVVRPPDERARPLSMPAERLRREAMIATAAVGLISAPEAAEEIIANERADLVRAL